MKLIIDIPDYSLDDIQNGSIACGQILKAVKNGIPYEPKDEWIPVTTRRMTEEEEKEYRRDWGIDETAPLEEWETKILTCSLPCDRQEILICTKWGIKLDTCVLDDGLYGLEEYGYWDGVIAWRPLPEPYKEET